MAAPGGMQARRGGLLVEIETDESVIGIGEAGSARATQSVIEKQLAPMLIGEDAADRRALAEDVLRAPASSAAAGVVSERDQRHRHRAVGHCRQGREIAALPPLWRLPRRRSRLMPAAAFTRKANRSTISPARPRATAPAAFKAVKMKIGNSGTQSHLRHLVDHAELCELSLRRTLHGCGGSSGIGTEGKADGRRQLRLSPPSRSKWAGRSSSISYWIEEPVATGPRRQREGRRCARHPDRRLDIRNPGLRVPRADHPRRRRYRSADLAWAGGFWEYRRIAALSAGASPDGGAARLCRRCAARRRTAFRRLDPERAGARIRPEPERPARRSAEGAGPHRKRRNDQAPEGPGSASSSTARRSSAIAAHDEPDRLYDRLRRRC